MAIPIIHSNQPPHSIDLQPRSCADFDLGKIAGEGSYSTVLNAIEKSTGMHYAIKVLDKKQILKEKKQKYVGIEKRVFQMSALHPLIIQLYYTFQDTHSLYFCLELASNGNLLEFCDSCCSSSSRSSRSVGGGGGGGNSMSGTRSDTRSSGTSLTSGLSIDIVRFFGAEISVALQYLHSKGVLHRDLKPENILLSEKMHIKLTDFGSAKILVTEGIAQPENTNMSTKERKNSFVGTAEYCSPELLDGRQESAKSDVWAFGCVLFKLITSHLPFKGGSEYLTFQLVLAQSITFPKTIDKEAKDLISKILIKDTDKRLNLDQVKSHPFFGLIDWTRLIDSESPAIGYEYGKKKESNHASLSNECIDKFSHNLPHQSTTTATHPTATQPTTQPTDTPTHPSTQPVSTTTTTPSPAMNESTLSSLNTFATNHYSHLLKKDELIIKYGLVIRKQLLINSKYLLFLTSIKRILLVDSTSYIVRKELFVKVNATLKSKDCFIISSGEKEYVMRLPTNNAHEWVYCVNKTFSDCV